MKIGVGITTFNKEDFYKDLYDTIPFDKIDEVITTNMGDEYVGTYDKTYMNQWTEDYGPCRGRNENIQYLYDKGCDYIFLVEDDVLIKNPEVFNTYVDYCVNTGIKYFIYCSDSDGSGKINQRTPTLKIKYPNDQKVCFYPNMRNDFVCHHRSNFDDRLYDETYKYIFDIEYTYYHMVEKKVTTPFWWFPDIENSDNYVQYRLDTSSRLDNHRNPEKLNHEFKKLEKKTGFWVNHIPKWNEIQVKNRLKELYNEKSSYI